MKNGAWMFVTAATLLAAPPPPAAKTPAAASAAEFTRVSKAASTAREANKLEDALQLYGQALRLKPKWPEGWWYAGTILYELDRYKDAKAALGNLVALDGKMAAGFALLGLCEYELKEYEPATAHLDRARNLGLSPSDQLGSSAFYHLSILLTRYERYEAALTVLMRAAGDAEPTPSFIAAAGAAALHKPFTPRTLPTEDRDAVYLAGKAVLDAHARRVHDAQLEFEELATRFPQEPNVHFLFGSFLLPSNPDAGLAELQKELEISPKNVPDMIQIADEYLKRGDNGNALKYAIMAEKADPQSFITKAFLGRCLVANDRTEEGIAELEMAEKLAPDSPQIRLFLASAYAKVGRKDDASRERAEFQRLKPAGN